MSGPNDHHTLRTAREAEGFYELELYEEALRRADQLLADGKLERFSLALRAECLRCLGRWEEGAGAFEKILRREPEEVSAYVGLGWCLKRAGRLDHAMETLNQLLAVSPREGIGLYNLACYCSLAGDRDRALDYLQRSIEVDTQYRELAEAEEDFASLREDPAFRRILSGELPPAG
jgi:tetratricopeptide (TPR) repeat protein